jgi:hypothetical protein
MTKRTLLLFPVLGVLTFVGIVGVQPKQASAHRSGCHRWHSCPSDSGSYVCGDLGYYSECPGGAPTTKKPVQKQRIPVVTKKKVNTDTPIVFKTIERKNYHEYPSFRKVMQPGANGVSRAITELTLTDGVQTASNAVGAEVPVAVVDEIVDVGARIEPLAKITRFWSTKKKDHFDIKGTFKPNAEVVISVNGKRVKRAKTDGNGVFMFRGIKVTQQAPELIIYERKNRKEQQISEKTFVDRNTKAFTTEYQKLHQQQ